MQRIFAGVLALVMLGGCAGYPTLYREELVGLGAGAAVGGLAGGELGGVWGAAGGAILGGAVGLTVGDSWADQHPGKYDPGLFP